MPSMTSESHDDPDYGRRELSGPRLVARLQHPREPPRRDDGRAQDPGTGRHRRGRRRGALSLGHQPPRDQRDDRLLRPSPPGSPGRADPRSASRLEAEDRYGLPVAAGRDRHGSTRPRAAQPRARLCALPRPDAEAHEVHGHQPLHAGQGPGRRPLREPRRPGHGPGRSPQGTTRRDRRRGGPGR